MTTVETRTQPPNDSQTLSIILNKTRDALSATFTQISDLQNQMAQRRGRLDELQVLYQESAALATHMGRQVREAEMKLSRARIAAGIAKGTLAEGDRSQHIEALQAALAAQQEKLQEAQQAYSTQDTQVRVESDAIRKQLEEDEKVLEALQRTRWELQQERDGRNVPTGMLYGTVVEHVDMSVEEMQGILARLGCVSLTPSREGRADPGTPHSTRW